MIRCRGDVLSYVFRVLAHAPTSILGVIGHGRRVGVGLIAEAVPDLAGVLAHFFCRLAEARWRRRRGDLLVAPRSMAINVAGLARSRAFPRSAHHEGTSGGKQEQSFRFA